MDFHRQARPSVGLTLIYQSSLTLAPILYAFAQKINASRAISRGNVLSVFLCWGNPGIKPPLHELPLLNKGEGIDRQSF
jgi:hypothetical protein